MHSPSALRRTTRSALGFLAAALLAAAAPAAHAQPAAGSPEIGASSWEMRVCADPNNLPYSNREEEGFENKIAELVAEELGAQLAYHWYPQRRGLVRLVLRKGACDLVIGVPQHYELLQTSAPYYRSGFVFVTREDRDLDLQSLEDPALEDMRIGLHVQEGEGLNPPAQILARRGLTTNFATFSVYGDYSQDSPLAGIVSAVASGEVDVAVVWGPAASYFARQSDVPLSVTPIQMSGEENYTVPMEFQIAMGMRRGDAALGEAVSRVIEQRRESITAMLEEYGVPTLPLQESSSDRDDDDDD